MKKEILSVEEIKFIETFVKKSTRYLLEKPKEVAAICKVSVYQVNKCFSNIRFMDKLDRGMNKKVLEYTNKEWPDNYILNLVFVQKKLRDLRKLTSQKKSDANQKQQIKI